MRRGASRHGAMRRRVGCRLGGGAGQLCVRLLARRQAEQRGPPSKRTLGVEDARPRRVHVAHRGLRGRTGRQRRRRVRRPGHHSAAQTAGRPVAPGMLLLNLSHLLEEAIQRQLVVVGGGVRQRLGLLRLSSRWEQGSRAAERWQAGGGGAVERPRQRRLYPAALPLSSK